MKHVAFAIACVAALVCRAPAAEIPTPDNAAAMLAVFPVTGASVEDSLLRPLIDSIVHDLTRLADWDTVPRAEVAAAVADAGFPSARCTGPSGVGRILRSLGASGALVCRTVETDTASLLYLALTGADGQRRGDYVAMVYRSAGEASGPHDTRHIVGQLLLCLSPKVLEAPRWHPVGEKPPADASARRDEPVYIGPISEAKAAAPRPEGFRKYRSELGVSLSVTRFDLLNDRRLILGGTVSALYFPRGRPTARGWLFSTTCAYRKGAYINHCSAHAVLSVSGCAVVRASRPRGAVRPEVLMGIGIGGIGQTIWAAPMILGVSGAGIRVGSLGVFARCRFVGKMLPVVWWDPVYVVSVGIEHRFSF